jgi:hypothetical protein
MEKKYIKSTDVTKIIVSDRKELEIPYHRERPEKRNFWGTITQEFYPEGYLLRGWGANGDFYTKNPVEYAVEYSKRLDTKIEYVDGKFFRFATMTINYKGEQYPDVYYFLTYNEAIQASERLAGLCNLVAIIE